MLKSFRSFSTLSRLSHAYSPSTTVQSLKSGHSVSDDISLSSKVFGTQPRIDIIHENLKWQATYKVVDWRCITTRADLTYRSQKKPWPQKGLGKARHGNKRTHLWIGGGQCHGPRGPQNYFSVLPLSKRLKGLTSTLTVKHLQDDFKVVDSFLFSDEIEAKCEKFFTTIQSKEIVFSDDDDFLISDWERKSQSIFREASEKLREILDEKNWKESVLFIHDNMTESKYFGMIAACSSYAHFIENDISERSSARPIPIGANPTPRAMHPGRGLTLMPVESLNVWSMIHHDKLVVTPSALECIQQKIEEAFNSTSLDHHKCDNKFSSSVHYPNWLSQRDLSDDSDYEIKRERHFTGLIPDLNEFRRNLS